MSSYTEYDAGPHSIAGYDKPVRLRGLVVLPDDPSEHSPIAFICHWNAPRCLKADKFLVTHNYDCPKGYTEAKNADGMMWLAEQLAWRGYVAVSIDSNQLMDAPDDAYASLQIVGYRARQLEGHINYWRETPPAPCNMNNITLIGHSLGGSVALVAGIDLPGLTNTVLITPTSVAEWIGIDPTSRTAIVLAGCEEDEGGRHFEGLHLFDRMIAKKDRPEIMQAVIDRASHGQFNSENLPARSSGCSRPPMDGEQQRKLAGLVIADWLTGAAEMPKHHMLRVSRYAGSPRTHTPVFMGMDVTTCSGNECHEGYLHTGESWKVSWTQFGMAQVQFPASKAFSFRVANLSDKELILSITLMNDSGNATFNRATIPPRIESAGTGPSALAQTVRLETKPDHTRAQIYFQGKGAAILSRFETNE